MGMSETTGWRNGGRACDYIKEINGKRYEIHRGREDWWYVWLHGTSIDKSYYLADAKRAAHKHAEEKE